MAFEDSPNVDPSSKTSEESVLAVKSFFTRKNGFISREEIPDYGCDLNIELIHGNENASSQQFPVQIKSDQDNAVIEVGGNRYISKSMETSRIGYLCRRPPAYGLIVVYDEKSGVCYYDYVEEIVNRLTEHKKGDAWKKQESVSIHIPIENILRADALPGIHQQFSTRFQAHELLLAKYGAEFDIPSFIFKIKPEAIISNITDQPVAELIQKYGLAFINSYDILLLYRMFEQVPLAETLASKELIYIAAIVYGEMGKCIEADLYLSKAFQQIDNYNESEKEILRFVRIKIDFLLGRRSKDEYYDDLKSMTEVVKNEFNAIQLKINLLHYTIIQHIEEDSLDEQLEGEIMRVFEAIEKGNIDEEHKHLLAVFQAENLHMYISSFLLRWVSRLRIRDSMMIPVSQQERQAVYQKSNESIEFAIRKSLEALGYAQKNEKKIVKAHAEYALGRFYFTRQYHFMMMAFRDDHPGMETEFKRSFLFAVDAGNVFLDLGLLKEARWALICAVDLLTLAKLYYHLDVTTKDIAEDTIVNNLKVIEEQMGLPSHYVSIVVEAFNQFGQLHTASDEDYWKTVDDQGLEKFAKVVLEARGLPKDRFINILNELKAQRFFARNVDTDVYKLLVNLDHLNSPNTAYARPTSYIIVSTKSGMQSMPSTDVEKLTLDFGAMKK